MEPKLHKVDNIITLPVSKKVSPVTSMTGKQFALHLNNIRNEEIRKRNNRIIENEKKMQLLRDKHGISRHSFFKLPYKDFKKFHQLQTENFLNRSAIFSLVSNEF